MDQRPKLKTWAEGIGLEPEEALAILIMLDEMSTSNMDSFKQEIAILQDIVASVEIEKMLEDEHDKR